ncbi:MAG: DegV family protein [Lachnospiraceae bacterium]|nr:DegV family protein [Lachnospiraceae bacterium]
MYKIIIDSCGELTEQMKADGHFSSVALELEVDDVRIKDDETFDQADFIRRVNASKKGPKSSCPSPESYMSEYEGEAENVYAVTLSANLSGSYNSAMLAVNLYKDEHDDNKNIHVFNSCSASVGETLIGLKIQECEEAGMSFEEVIKAVDEYIAEQNTFFVLESLETLRKTGRLSNIKALVASTLNIKPVMGATPKGTICQLGQARGMKKALAKMIEEMTSVTKNCENKILAITHCNCLDRALYVKELVEKAAKFREIIILDTRGVSTMYANDGGIILVV